MRWVSICNYSMRFCYAKTCHRLFSRVCVTIRILLTVTRYKDADNNVYQPRLVFGRGESDPLGHRLLRDNLSKPLCLLRHTEGAALFPHSGCRFELRTHLYGDIIVGLSRLSAVISFCVCTPKWVHFNLLNFPTCHDHFTVTSCTH